MTDESKMIWMYLLIYTILIPIHLIAFFYFFGVAIEIFQGLNIDTKNSGIFVVIAMSVYVEILTYLVYLYNLRYVYKEKNKKIFKILSVVNFTLIPFIIYVSIFKI